ncbi:MAG TPA: sporulation protein YqfD, partial [Bacillota bacterium]|nr:sporulation protein YqfD [Bacillota bacterium]
RRRWGLVAGVLIFGAALYFSTAVVWQVRIIGTEHIDEAEVLELAGQLGLRPGVWKRSLDLAGLEEALARRHPDITWASIRLRGTLALIEIVEQLPEPEIERGPADLVAAKDGLITRVLVLDGEAVVAPGDTVVKGDLLIRGALVVPDHSPGEEQQPEAIPVRARGEVEARVWYEAVAPINRVVPQHIDTGASTKSYLLSWPGKSLRLFGPAESPFDKSRQEVVKWRWRWRNLSLPVELVTVVYHEVHITEKVISESEALQQSRDRAMELLKRQLPEGVKVEQLYFQEFREQSQDYVRAVAETLENIAEYRPLNP